MNETDALLEIARQMEIRNMIEFHGQLDFHSQRAKDIRAAIERQTGL